MEEGRNWEERREGKLQSGCKNNKINTKKYKKNQSQFYILSRNNQKLNKSMSFTIAVKSESYRNEFDKNICNI